MGAKCWITGALAALVVAAAGAAQATPSFPASAAGDWSGTLGPMGAVRHLFIHIHKTMAGGYVGAMDSPEQGPGSVPLTPITAEDGRLAFKAGDAEYRGSWDVAAGEWRGTWTQDGASSPVILVQDVDDTTSSRIARH